MVALSCARIIAWHGMRVKGETRAQTRDDFVGAPDSIKSEHALFRANQRVKSCHLFFFATRPSSNVTFFSSLLIGWRLKPPG